MSNYKKETAEQKEFRLNCDSRIKSRDKLNSLEAPKGSYNRSGWGLDKDGKNIVFIPMVKDVRGRLVNRATRRQEAHKIKRAVK